jgi:hypothetical protein
MFAYREKEEGIIKWAVRPIANNQFEKKLLAQSNSKILNSHAEEELEKCLQNPDVAQSIRDNFKDGEWDEFHSEYELPKHF